MEEIDREFNKDFQDMALVCCDCHAEFVFTRGEQRFFWEKNLVSPPRRCPTCRKRRKATIAHYREVRQ